MDSIEVYICDADAWLWDEVAMLRFFSNPQPVVLVQWNESTRFWVSLTLEELPTDG